SGASVPGVKITVPSLFQTPPRAFSALQISSAGPPASGTFFSAPLAKKPSHRPSGEKKGSVAPSVPSIGCAADVANGRSKSFVLPETRRVEIRCVPSGENKCVNDWDARAPSTGWARVNCLTGSGLASPALLLRYIPIKAPVATKTAAAQPRFPRVNNRLCASGRGDSMGESDWVVEPEGVLRDSSAKPRS